MNRKIHPIVRAADVLAEGDRKGGYIGEFNTLGKMRTVKRKKR